MRKLLIFVDWFLPGYKAGGQIRSCANLSYALKGEMDIYVVTTDRDQGSEEPYPMVKADEWNTIENSLQVLYLSPGNRGFKTIHSVIKSVNPDCIYLNSMFSYSFTILPIVTCSFYHLDHIKILLAPRGMLHTGALQYKKIKKSIFFSAFRLLQLHRKVVFHATDPTEETDIKITFGQTIRVKFVDDFPTSHQEPLLITEKKQGQLKCLFVSRISPKKNLLFVLELLKHIKAGVDLSIVGPIEDIAYYQHCKNLVAVLPANIKVSYLGAIPNHELFSIYQQNHLFVLTTFGENFGHVIFESLLYGRPVLISDHTPWRNLQEKKIGWEFPLSEIQKFSDALEEAAEWDQLQFNVYAEASWQYANEYFRKLDLNKRYLKLFS